MGAGPAPREVGGLLRGGVALSAAMMAAGLAASSERAALAGISLLILTPAARVALLARDWARARDWAPAACAGTVLALMALCALLGAS